MNNNRNDEHEVRTHNRLVNRVGLALIISGLIVLLDQRLKTGWLTLLIVPAIGLTFLISGIRARRMLAVAPGAIIATIGLAALIIFSPLFQLTWPQRVGFLLLASGLGAFLIMLIGVIVFRRVLWWALFVAVALFSVALPFLVTPMRITDFALYGLTGVGLSLLAWGVASRLFGLIIPGCLLLGIGPGIYVAWSGVNEPSSLARVGIMLVYFALGWGLIILFSRVLTTRFTWWPLIPGGILAMVGWGLYIGGNPGNAVSFIGNTGSIGLIIFGVYLLLLRRGIQN